MRKVFALVLAAVLFTALFSGVAVSAERTGTGVRMETERVGDVLNLKVIANEDINLGGIGFTTVPTFDTAVFSFKRVVPRTGLDCEQPASANNYLYVDTTNDTTVPANEVIFTVEYDIIGTVVPGTEYEFVGHVEEAFGYDWHDYDWVDTDVTGVYVEEEAANGPAVSFQGCTLRERTEPDAADAIRITFKVVFNDSFINYAGTIYGAEGESNYEITALSVEIARTDVDPAVVNTVPCTKLFGMLDEEPGFLFNVTLTGVTERHYTWQFQAIPTVTYVLGGETFTATCDAAQFTINDILSE